MSPSYRFRTVWRLPHAPERVWDVLADVERYPDWWPQVRSGRRIDATSGEVTCRSLLPYDLTFRLRRDVEDRSALILRARMDGDLVGTSQWTVRADGPGCEAVFEEEVSVGRSAVRLAGRLVRPALVFNHGLMMRAGERGLRRYLATQDTSDEA